jgi:hypothetical protein
VSPTRTERVVRGPRRFLPFPPPARARR